MGIIEIGVLFFAWDLGVIFLGIPIFQDLKIRKKKFFENLDFGCHREMCRLVPCIPILGGFFIKSAKWMGMRNYVSFAIGTF